MHNSRLFEKIHINNLVKRLSIQLKANLEQNVSRQNY